MICSSEYRPFFISKLLSSLELFNYDWQRLSRAGHRSSGVNGFWP